MNSYKTIRSGSEGIFKEKGSKFLAYAFPVSSEEEIRQHIEQLKKEHYSARHHCYAYKLGADGSLWRVNDAGEPTNSAGKPILGQIQNRELTNVLVVVVRYFGGTLLGMGGLIQAYKGAASDALDHSEIIEVEIMHRGSVEFSFDEMNEVMRLLRTCNCKISDQQFGENKVNVMFGIPRGEIAKFTTFANKIPHKISYEIENVN